MYKKVLTYFCHSFSWRWNKGLVWKKTIQWEKWHPFPLLQLRRKGELINIFIYIHIFYIYLYIINKYIAKIYLHFSFSEIKRGTNTEIKGSNCAFSDLFCVVFWVHENIIIIGDLLETCRRPYRDRHAWSETHGRPRQSSLETDLFHRKTDMPDRKPTYRIGERHSCGGPSESNMPAEFKNI